MIQVKKSRFIKILSLLFSVVFILLSLPITVSAATVMDGQSVVKDLENMGIDVTAYAKDTEDKNAKILEFLEFCYDSNGNQNDYGLYIYVYNPTAEPISASSEYNTVQLYTVDKSGGTTMWGKVKLITVSFSTGNDKNGRDISHLFYKFKVDTSKLKNFVMSLPSGRREYRIVDLELQYGTEANPRASKIANSYICTGYQPYHGGDSSSDHSSYFCVSNVLEAIEIDLHQATWKTASSDKGENYQYEVSSVYFALPDYYLQKYGDMSDENFKGLHSVSGEWYEYKINGLITNNVPLFDLAQANLGRVIPSVDGAHSTGAIDVEVPLCFYSQLSSALTDKYYERSYNYHLQRYDGIVENPVRALCNSFNFTGDEFKTISSKRLMDSIYGSLGGDKFYRLGYVDEGRRFDRNSYTITVKDDDLNDLIGSYASNHNDFVTWLTGKGKLNSDKGGYDPINPIKMIKAEDVGGSGTADKLFVCEGDYSELQTFYTASSVQNKTVYLMRFAVTDYYFAEVDARKLNGTRYDSVDGNHYYFEKTIFHNFDVMEFTFRNSKGEYTTVPVSTRPISVVGSITTIDKSDGVLKDFTYLFEDSEKAASWMTVIALILGLALVLVLVIKFGPVIKKWIRKLRNNNKKRSKKKSCKSEGKEKKNE